MVGNSNPAVIQQKWLVWVYAIVPPLVLLVLVDWLFLGKALQPYLTTSALHFPLYVLFFELPHIIASLLSFADRDYIRSYRSNLFVFLPLIVIGFSFLIYFSFALGVLFYAVYTMYHFVRQQTGIALTFTRMKDWWHEVWTYLGVISTALGFVIIFSYQYIPVMYALYAGILLVPISVLFLGVSSYTIWRAPTARAKWYVSGVTLSITLSYILLMLDYLFLAVFILRFVHDITAFIFYIAHDTARNAVQKNNVIYSFFKTVSIPTLLATPLLAIVIGYFLRAELMVFQLGIVMIMAIGVTHYYLEGVMWKKNAPHRAQLRFE